MPKITVHGKTFDVKGGVEPIDDSVVARFVGAALDAMDPGVVSRLHAEDLRWQDDETPDPHMLLCYLADAASELAGFDRSDPTEVSVYIQAIR